MKMTPRDKTNLNLTFISTSKICWNIYLDLCSGSECKLIVLFVVFVFTNSFKSNQDLHQVSFCGITTRHVLLFPIGDPGCKKRAWEIGLGRSPLMLPFIFS